MITFKSPVTLTIVAGSLVATLLPGAPAVMALHPAGLASWLDPFFYSGIFGHIFVHSGLAHWANNMALILLLAPALESRYGSLKFVGTMGALTFLVGISESLLLIFTQKTVIGASDLVFALILMTTFAQSRKGEIPIASILVAILWGVHELGGLLTKDSIANSAHLVGAAWGFVWGLWLLPKESAEKSAEPTPAAIEKTAPAQ
jgi:GlpG protein